MNLTVAELIESAAIVSCNASIREAVETMQVLNCDRVYVTDETGRISSVACDYRLLKAKICSEQNEASIQQYSAPLNEILNPSQPLAQAAVFFRTGHQTELPVFEAHQFLGVVRRTSLLAALMSSPEVVPDSSKNPIDAGDQKSSGSSLTGMLNKKSLKLG